MKNFLAMVAVGVLVPGAVWGADGSAPLPLGTFGDWTAATYGVGKHKACYAFTKAQGSSEAIAGRGDVLLVVTERTSGHDEVTISAGYAYPPKPSVMLDVGGPKIDFYTQGQTAFTTDGTGAISGFQQGSTATAKSTAPDGSQVTDIFSLAGFSDAYSAITTACP